MSKQATDSIKAYSFADGISDFDVLFEIGNMGAGHAAKVLSDILHEPVMVEVPRLHLTEPHLVPQFFSKHDAIVAAVFMQLRDKPDCDVVLMLDAGEAEHIATLMLSITESEQIDDEMKRSAVEELGSIMICSFLNAIADFTLTELVPNPPQVIYDSFDAILESFLVKQALCSNLAVVFDTCFRRCGNSAEGCLIMFPSEELRKTLINNGKRWLENLQDSKDKQDLNVKL
ncbi:MAG: chemotaxis protein CheC [Candidatus Bathyarchaeia archaeon]